MEELSPPCYPATVIPPVATPIVAPVITPVTAVATPIMAIDIPLIPAVPVVIKSTSLLPTNPENIAMWITSFILTILFFVGAYYGARGAFFQSLPVKTQDNAFLIGGLWVIASLISYASFYLVRGYDECIYGQSRLLPLFLIISYLNILWVVVFYIYGSFLFTVIILAIIVLVNLYIIVFLLQINIWAALSVVPLFFMYIYLLYTFINLGSLNGAF